jgi:hypothetical protein
MYLTDLQYEGGLLGVVMPRGGPVMASNQTPTFDKKHARTHALTAHHSTVCEAQHRGYIRETPDSPSAEHSGPCSGPACCAPHRTAQQSVTTQHLLVGGCPDFILRCCCPSSLTLRPDSQIALPILGAFLILRLVSRGGPLDCQLRFRRFVRT